MNLEQLGRRDALLSGLLKQAGQWRRLDAAVKNCCLPTCTRISDGLRRRRQADSLAANNMAASRLKMIAPSVLPQLAGLDASIRSVSVRLVPKPEKPPKTNTLHLSKAALESFGSAAAKLEKRHPELAEALANLVRRHGA